LLIEYPSICLNIQYRFSSLFGGLRTESNPRIPETSDNKRLLIRPFYVFVILSMDSQKCKKNRITKAT
jgi:hypothetical protein